MNPYRFEFLEPHRDLNLREFLTDLFKFEHVILLSWTPFSPRNERLNGVHVPVRRLICQLRTLRLEKREEGMQPTNMKA
jgi:hypothetical protein